MEGSVFEIIDDHPIHFHPEAGKNMPNQIVGERPLLGGVAHKHRNRCAHTVVHIDDETLVVIANKDRAAIGCRQNSAHVNFDNIVLHDR